MKTIKTHTKIITILVAILVSNTLIAQSSGTISLHNEEYTNSMYQTWNINTGIRNSTIVFNYNVSTENSCDYVSIYELDENFIRTKQIITISGQNSGTISATIASGCAQIEFGSDAGVSYADGAISFWGFQVDYSSSIIDNTASSLNLEVLNNAHVGGNLEVFGNQSLGGNLKLGMDNQAKMISGLSTGGAIEIKSDSTTGGSENRYLRLGWNDNNSSFQPVLSINEDYNVGIGTVKPRAALDVGTFIDNGQIGTVFGRMEQGNEIGDGTYLGVRGYETRNINFNNKSFSIEHHFFGQTMSSINFFVKADEYTGIMTIDTNNNERMRIDSEGRVGIGTSSPDNLLTVNGVIHAREVKIDLNIPLADFVFNENYKLMSLPQLEKFVKTNNHLPEIPSANEVKKNGLSIGEMQNKLLQKVEELTLYVIEQQKKIEKLEKKLKMKSHS